MLDLGPSASIVEVACHCTPSLTSLSSPSIESALDWLQVSFTARAGGDYIRCPICTRRDLVVMTPSPGSYQANLVSAHLNQQFPGHFCLLSPPTTPPTSQSVSQETIPQQEGGGDDPIQIFAPKPPANTRISWEDPNHTDMGSLIPGWERPGQRVDSFRLRGGAPSQASLTPTPITPVRTHSALENGDNGGGGTGGPGPRIRGPGSGTGVPVLPGAAGGGGAPPPPPGAAIGPITGNIDIAAIVTVAVQAVTTGYASATATANACTAGSTRTSPPFQSSNGFTCVWSVALPPTWTSPRSGRTLQPPLPNKRGW